jgi:hypothetical protein
LPWISLSCVSSALPWCLPPQLRFVIVLCLQYPTGGATSLAQFFQSQFMMWFEAELNLSMTLWRHYQVTKSYIT